MNDDPSEVDVLYAKVGQADQLQDVAEKIIDRYIVFYTLEVLRGSIRF